jgi:outer membrane biosynthesis protein TonB
VEDREYYGEEEEEAAEEEGANRTFIILVAALGGLLALGICAFVVWAFVLAPRMRADIEAQNQIIMATNTAVAAAMAGAETVEAPPMPAETTVPTDTPEPTRTRVPTPTPAPEEPTAGPEEATAAPEELTETPAEVAQATPKATATSAPVPTRRPTATPRSATGEEEVPDTGIGTLGAGALAIGLLFLLVVVRRLRRAV